MQRDSLTANQIQSLSFLGPRKNQGFSLLQHRAQTANKVRWGHVQCKVHGRAYSWETGTQYILHKMMKNKNIVYTKYSKLGLCKLYKVVGAEVFAWCNLPHFSIFCSTFNFCRAHVPPVLLLSFGFYLSKFILKIKYILQLCF